ncbi:MAG: hypothetical protein R2759_11790 [Bacteroidales bacterium]
MIFTNLCNSEKKKQNQPIESLVDFVQQNNISYKMLKELNPWLRNRSLPNSSGKHIGSVYRKTDKKPNENYFGGSIVETGRY